MTNKKWRKNILLAAAVAGILAYYIHNRQAEQAASVKAQEMEKAKAVAMLPPGTIEAWDAWMDGRISSLLQRNGNTVRLGDYDGKTLSELTFVSVTSSYKISCGISESSIEFPQYTMNFSTDNGADITEAITLYIYKTDYKSASEESVYINPDSSGEQPPPLGVNEESIAANELRAHLCQRIADKVQAIFSLQPPTDGA